MKLIACGRVSTFFFFFPLENVNTSSFFFSNICSLVLLMLLEPHGQVML